ncbi:hypothetical protein AAMO2058_000281100 [Amorphochlora amoebiformis]
MATPVIDLTQSSSSRCSKCEGISDISLASCKVCSFPPNPRDGGMAKRRRDCYKCGQPGHWVKNCPLKDGSGLYDAERRARRRSGACFECGESGHYAKACPKKQVMEMGFSEEQAIRALRQAGGETKRAIEIILGDAKLSQPSAKARSKQLSFSQFFRQPLHGINKNQPKPPSWKAWRVEALKRKRILKEGDSYGAHGAFHDRSKRSMSIQRPEKLTWDTSRTSSLRCDRVPSSETLPLDITLLDENGFRSYRVPSPTEPLPLDMSLLDAYDLSDEQRQVFEAIKGGHNTFFTGCAGTGKSFVLSRILDILPKGGEYGVFKTASTGIAAVHIGGITLHSWAGVRLAREPLNELRDKISKDAIERLRETRVLIIDEISMIDAEVFDKIEGVARYYNKNDRPFGGIQLVVCGDFLQLPPVGNGGGRNFAFFSSAWKKCKFKIIELKKIFRQKNIEFQNMLNKIRLGRMTPEVIKMLNSRVKAPIRCENGIKATKLYPTKRQVIHENTGKLKELKSQTHCYQSADGGNPKYLAELMKSCPAPAQLFLKVGAQVMLVKNLDFGSDLVNGSRGVIVRFEKLETKFLGLSAPKNMWPLVRFQNGEERLMEPQEWGVEIRDKKMAFRQQVPLILAWALTIHKCQGMTLDSAKISLKNIFEDGQVSRI